MKKQLKHKKHYDQRIYAIYDGLSEELVSVSLDYSILEMQFQLSDMDKNRFEIVEFDIRLV